MFYYFLIARYKYSLNESVIAQPQPLHIGNYIWSLVFLSCCSLVLSHSKYSGRIILRWEICTVLKRKWKELSIYSMEYSTIRYNTIVLQTHFMTYPRQYLNLKEFRDLEEINIFRGKKIMILKCFLFSTSAWDAWCHVSKANCCHRHETKIERVEQSPVLPDDKDAGPGDVEEDHRCEPAQDHQEVPLQADWIRHLTVIARGYFFRTKKCWEIG